MTAYEKAAALVRQFEGCELKAYPDPATHAAPYTIGWGCTGPDIHCDTVWTQEQADDALHHRLAALEGVVRSLVRVDVTDDQVAAMCSLAWNIGSHAFAGSRVLRDLNAGNGQSAAADFRNWERAGTQPHLLEARREKELAYFLGDESVLR